MNSNKRRQGNLAAIVAGVMVASPVVEMQNFALAGAGMARVTVQITHTDKSRVDHALVAQAIEQKLEGRMTAIAGSFTTLESNRFTETITGIVSAKREVMAVTEANMKGFKATASNMFMDDESDMWVMRKTEAGGVLIKTTGIDDDMSLVSLLESHSSAGFRNSPDYGRVTASAHSLAESVQGGAFVSFVGPDNIIRHGYCVATDAESDLIAVLPVGASEVEATKRAAVTQVHDTSEFPQTKQTPEEEVAQVVASARGEVDLPFLAEFYKKEYQRSPAFYALFLERLNNHQFF